MKLRMYRVVGGSDQIELVVGATDHADAARTAASLFTDGDVLHVDRRGIVDRTVHTTSAYMVENGRVKEFTDER